MKSFEFEDVCQFLICTTETRDLFPYFRKEGCQFVLQKMANDITLQFDSQAVGPISSRRVMVAVPLLYLFLTHYLFQMMRLIKGAKEAGERLNDLGRRLCLFGVASLFSLNFLQSSILGSVIAWVVLVQMIIAHCFAFLRQTGQKYHNICLLVYYTLMTLWFGCELFYFILNAL